MNLTLRRSIREDVILAGHTLANGPGFVIDFTNRPAEQKNILTANANANAVPANERTLVVLRSGYTN